jgi:hypothetical protein
MTRHLPALLGVALFSFFGLFDQTEEYGDLTAALKRTMAQSLPPYHQTRDASGAQMDLPDQPAANNARSVNPPAAAERTPQP